MSLTRSPLALSALATLLTALTTGAFAQTALPVSSYTSSSQFTLASGINDNGVISGTVQQSRGNLPVEFIHAAKWTSSMGVYSLLDLGQLKPDGDHNGRWMPSWANGINNSAQIVGNSYNGGTASMLFANSPQAYSWTSSGPMVTLAEDDFSHFIWVYAIDVNGWIFGAREPTGDSYENGGWHTAYYWTDSNPSNVFPLGNLPGSGEKWAEALGSNGTIVVGHATENDMTISPRAVYWSTVSSAPVSVGKPSGMTGSCSRLLSVKDVTIIGSTHTIAAGMTANSPDSHAANSTDYFAGGLGAYAYDITNSSFIVLPVPAGGYSTASAVAINSSGVIVGSAYKQAVDGMGNPILVEYACKWTPDGLGSYPTSGAAFLSTGSSFSRLIRATGINSSGTIVGMGLLSSTVRAFVL